MTTKHTIFKLFTLQEGKMSKTSITFYKTLYNSNQRK